MNVLLYGGLDSAVWSRLEEEELRNLKHFISKKGSLDEIFSFMHIKQHLLNIQCNYNITNAHHNTITPKTEIPYPPSIPFNHPSQIQSLYAITFLLTLPLL